MITFLGDKKMTSQEKMKHHLEELGLPFIEIRTYGHQITIECKSKSTAEKWVSVLSKFAVVG
jgi:hypothetical protein